MDDTTKTVVAASGETNGHQMATNSGLINNKQHSNGINNNNNDNHRQTQSEFFLVINFDLLYSCISHFSFALRYL